MAAAVTLGSAGEARAGDQSPLDVTPEHPLYVERVGAFVKAGDLRAGNVLRMSDGSAAVVTAVERRDAPAGWPFEVYNFEVEGLHTYFVAPKTSPPGSAAVWVHNTACPWDEFDRFRGFKQGMDELGDAIPVKGDGRGTVAYPEVGETKVLGVKSRALRRKSDKVLAEDWREALGWTNGEAQSLFHAEAHALMMAFSKYNGKLPPSLRMVVGRDTCSFCTTALPLLSQAMGINTLTIVSKSGRIVKIHNGAWVR